MASPDRQRPASRFAFSGCEWPSALISDDIRSPDATHVWAPSSSLADAARGTDDCYRGIEALRLSPLMAAGTRMRGHEFHWFLAVSPPQHLAAYCVVGEERVEGFLR